jgi:hypothetical protein
MYFGEIKLLVQFAFQNVIYTQRRRCDTTATRVGHTHDRTRFSNPVACMSTNDFRPAVRPLLRLFIGDSLINWAQFTLIGQWPSALYSFCLLQLSKFASFFKLEFYCLKTCKIS